MSESLKVPAQVWRDAFAGLLEDDFASELGSIKAPTLLVWGDRDAFVPREDQGVRSAPFRRRRSSSTKGPGTPFTGNNRRGLPRDLVGVRRTRPLPIDSHCERRGNLSRRLFIRSESVATVIHYCAA